ncbi:hypothetical protein FQN60_015145 [Etheostoma spectabile]|uniref:Transmembrane protein 87B n=1 Tax=Etheostoma spectabile TaxID=54343 RepID=A0A5J5CQD2_9PERO|nr:hypothetical protein FQN60_015145 [Etheostoma spectabile]
MAAAVMMRTWSYPTTRVFYPWAVCCVVLLSTINAVVAAPETGVWKIPIVNTSRPLLLRKSMYKDTNIELKVVPFGCPEEVNFSIHWYLKYYPCHNEYNNIEEMYERTPLNRGEGLDPNPLGQGEYIEHRYSPITCNSKLHSFPMLKKAKAEPRPVSPPVQGEVPDFYNQDENDTKRITEEYDSSTPDVIATTWKDGPYLLVVKIESNKQDANWNLTVNVVMKGSHGYISITEWPLMIFYMVMCIVYILYALLWFIWAACYWKDLLRIQFWIAGVIFLGMVEKAVFCAEYENTNTVGSASPGLLIFAELVSALKRTLARLLVIIVSLGYGILKPRLGQVMHRVVGLGILYFAFAGIEGVLRITGAKDSDLTLLANIPLALLDSSLCWWISFCAPTTFPCDWIELWVEDAFWRFLFSAILYAFTPLIDDSDDEEIEEFASTNIADGIKLRASKHETNGTVKSAEINPEEDLKWVEDNIPSSLADVALPVLLDSDEEILTTRYEMSKLE